MLTGSTTDCVLSCVLTFKMFIAGIQISALLCLVAGGLFIAEGSYVLYNSFEGLQALLWSFDFYNATLYLCVCGLLLCVSSIYVIVDLIFSREFNTYVVLFLLAKAIVIEIGLGFGFSDVAAELSNELPVTLRHSLILASKEQYFQTAEFTEAWDYLQTNYGCCGVDSAKDWSDVDVSYPNSCCGGREADCGGCLVPLTHSIRSSVVKVWLLAVLLGLAIVVCTIGVTACFSCFRGIDKRSSYQEI